MAQRPSASAKAMMDEVERLHAEHGVYPTPRAVRGNMRGSQERADHAILAVKIKRGTLAHLRSALPDDFAAELPPATQIVSLTAEALTDLPLDAQRLANDLFAALGSAFRAQNEWMTTRVAAAESRYQDETHGLRDHLLEASRALDEQERTADHEMQTLRDTITTLRVEVGTHAGDVASKESELRVRVKAHDELLAQARETATTADARSSARIEELRGELEMERDRCRVAEQHVARLTATNEALLAELTRCQSDVRAKTPRDGPRSGATATSRAGPTRAKAVEATSSGS